MIASCLQFINLLTYKDVCHTAWRRNTASQKFGRAFLDSGDGCTFHDVAVCIAVGKDSFPLGMLFNIMLVENTHMYYPGNLNAQVERTPALSSVVNMVLVQPAVRKLYLHIQN